LEEARVAICRAYGVAGVHLLLEAPEEMPESAVEVLESRHPTEIAPPPAEVEPDCCVQQDCCEAEAPEEVPQPCRQDDALRAHFSQKYPSAAPCLREASFSLSETHLILQVTQGWHATRLELLKGELERDAAALLGHPVKVDITAPAVQADYEQARAARAAQLAREGIEEADFKRMKRSAMGRRIRDLDSFDSTCFRLCAYHFSEFDYFQFPQIYEAVTVGDLQAFLARVVTEERCALSVIKPLKEET
jgi:hypothetical protein